MSDLVVTIVVTGLVIVVANIIMVILYHLFGDRK